MTKICNKCGEGKPLTEYYYHKPAADGYQYTCRDCFRSHLTVKSRLKKGFQSLKPDYCECCQNTGEPLQLDHDHKTMKFRGFICRSCNMTLGHAGDNYEAVLKSNLDPMYLDYLAVAEWRMGGTVFNGYGKGRPRKDT
tara:strand:+ start:136 stop:549 length:414 start_codon:yes stop_codon:yes gene_type:complete